MPALSPTMTQGNLGKWLKPTGAEIAPGDILVEIETDKATMELECQEEGFLAKILVSDKKDVPINTPIAIVVENEADSEKFSDYSVEATGETPVSSEPESPNATPNVTSADVSPAVASSQSSNSENSRTIASPLAKSLAAEKGINISAISGTGPNGRIVKADVLAFKGYISSYTYSQDTPKATSAVSSSKAPEAAPSARSVPASSSAPFVDHPITNVRKVIASRLSQSKNTIPHFYLTIELNADKIMKLRQVLNSESNGKFKLSVNDFVVKAAALALKDVPEVNSSWQDTFIRQYKTADIAVAVATDNGLITPIVTNADAKGLSSISNSIKELAEKAKQGKLTPNEYQGGSFTISNLGMYGISHFTAIINPPHASILAVGGIQDKLVIDESNEKGFSVQQTMSVTLSNDHRVVDGAVGARWLLKFKGYFENPLWMLL